VLFPHLVGTKTSMSGSLLLALKWKCLGNLHTIL
jgi:hypothetical protein